MNHQYIDRRTRQVCNERFYGDLFVRALYSPATERSPAVFHSALIRQSSKRTSPSAPRWPLLKIGAPTARDMKARGKCEAQRSTSPLDRIAKKSIEP